MSLVPSKDSKGLKSHTPGFLTPPHYPVPFPGSIHRSRNSDPERGRDEGQSIVVPLDGDERKIVVISRSGSYSTFVSQIRHFAWL